MVHVLPVPVLQREPLTLKDRFTVFSSLAYNNCQRATFTLKQVLLAYSFLLFILANVSDYPAGIQTEYI